MKNRPEGLVTLGAYCFCELRRMRESSLDLPMTGEWCPRERVALIHAIIKHLNTFSILFCFWVCFCGLLPFFLYNSFFFIFFLLIFCLFCVMGYELFIF